MRQDGGGIPTSTKSAKETTFLLALQRPTSTAPPQKQETRVEKDTLEAIAIRCTASLRTSANHLELRGQIPRSQPHAHDPQHDLIASYLSSRVSSHCWGSRTAVSAVLSRTCVLLPAAATRSRLGLVRLTCRPPEYVRSILQSLA